MTKKITYGMVGGGRDAFIGEVHRQAAALDSKIELVAGHFRPLRIKPRHLGKI